MYDVKHIIQLDGETISRKKFDTNRQKMHSFIEYVTPISEITPDLNMQLLFDFV